jgi:glycosyltransferase involved in cell wall biosynthesis
MNIAVVNLTQGGLSGGSRKYLRHLVPLLRQDRRVQHLSLFIPSQVAGEFADTCPEVQSWPADDPWRNYAALKNALYRLAPDVVFFPTARCLHVGDIPTVIMVRNMEPLVVPFGGNRPREALKNLVRAYAARVACKRATHIIAVSQYVHDFLTQQWGIDAAKVSVVYHGLEPPDYDAVAHAPAWLPQAWHAPFLFTAGSIRPARGLEDIIRALAILRDWGVTQRLVIAGDTTPAMQFYRQRLNSLASQYGIATHVLWAGHLTPDNMSWCFRSCAAFVMTSRVEACPNIALEAMSHGCLCVSSRNSPMPEFFRGAALYYESGDAHSLAQQLMGLSDISEAQSTCLRRTATLQAQQFRWETTAEKTVVQFERAMGQSLATRGDSPCTHPTDM